MLDIRIIRETPEIVRKDLEKRGMKEKIKMFDELIKLDQKWRSTLQAVEQLRQKRNIASDKIAEQVRKGVKSKDFMKILADDKTKISGEIKKHEKSMDKYREKINYTLLRLPNILHESVPIGASDEDSVPIRFWGEKPVFNFEPKDHIDIGLSLNLLDIERAAKVSGARFYYLKNEAVQLEFALVHFVMNFLKKEDYQLFVPPVLIRERVMEGAGFLPEGVADIYKIKDEDLYLVGTSEQALAGLHMDEILEKDKLPLYYCGFSTCFRTEAGSHGKDTKGIFRVHQFDKMEMFVFSKPEDSWHEHELLIQRAEKLVQQLGLHHRVVNICTGDMGSVAAKKYDVEVWMPSQQKYRELISCSNCTDYQARRLNVRCREAPGMPTQFVHTLNSTALAIGRTIVAILENYQQADGSVIVPEVLRPYLDFDRIDKK